jgi:hypothetical protein
MTTGEGADKRSDDDRGANDRRGERIGIGGGDDSVTRIQLAARWAEAYGPSPDSLGSVLKRFRAAYEYLDAVTHGVEPPEVETDIARTTSASQPVAAPQYAPPAAPPPPAPPAYGAPQQQPGGYAPPPSPPPAPQPEPRPWA